MMRAKPWVLLMYPKVEPVLNDESGAENRGVFVALRASTRNDSRVPSVMLTALRTEMSMLARPGPRQFPKRRGALPRVYDGAGVNADSLNQAFNRSCGRPEVQGSAFGTRLGNCWPPYANPPATLLEDCQTLVGNPLWTWMIGAMFQPPRTFSPSPDEAQRRPRPNGRSQIGASTTRSATASID